jgi:hypothetical protein
MLRPKRLHLVLRPKPLLLRPKPLLLRPKPLLLRRKLVRSGVRRDA